jgi:hypothetical protein
MPDPYGGLLREVQQALDAAGIETSIKSGGDVAPDQLYVAIAGETPDAPRSLQLMFLPGMEEVPVLQQFVSLGIAPSKDALARVGEFLLAANVFAPLGGFGFVRGDNLLYFRYNAATSVDPLDLDELSWTMAMVTYLVSHIAPLIERVATGADLEQMLDELTEVIARDSADAGRYLGPDGAS